MSNPTCIHCVPLSIHCGLCDQTAIGGTHVQYDKDHADLVAYLQLKVKEKDWHGVSDAANDLRVMEAKRP